ncbi:Ig kappa chain V-III region [Labeo rohita]|uniref:Ig kappa chain V-III region n=1 Tax=Labeo rohita TaxID=84645 RepID=A0ABQ8L1F7_LABRO|nr:Ig kappa chain V-III region [Labeo rohita]
MWAQATESLTNIAVTLGADVNISCDLDIEEIYWYKHKSPDPPVLILRTYDSIYEKAKYENSIFTHKYSVKTNSRLFIRNISTDELGVYYCVKTSEPQKFSNGTKIYISDSDQRNQTSKLEPHDASQHRKSWRNLIIIIISSALLNVLLTITLIGCQAAEALTDRLIDLGQSVTVNSSKPHLFINNVTIDDAGLYYCVTTDTPPKYSNGTRLHITEYTAEIQNQTETNLTQCQTFTLISALLNGLLIIVLKKFILGSKRSRDSSKTFQTVNLQQLQFAVVDPPTSCQRFQSSQANALQQQQLKDEKREASELVFASTVQKYLCYAPERLGGIARVDEYIEQNQTHWHITILISALLNVLLIIVITGELFDIMCVSTIWELM